MGFRAGFFLPPVFRACRGWREDRRCALLAERALEDLSQLAVLGFQRGCGGGCFEAAQQRTQAICAG